MAYKQRSPIIILEGGTNAQSFATTDGVVIFDGTRLVTLAATGASGTILTSNGAGLAPSFQVGAGATISITGDTGGAIVSGSFTFTGGTTGLTFNGAGTTETLAGTLIVANGGTGRTTLTNHGVLVGAGTTAITQLAVGTTGQVLTGVTGADPVFSAPAASSITITGNTGGGLTGNSFTFSGGTTGLSFGGSGTTETLTITNLNLPQTVSSSVGSITMGGTRLLHCYSAASDFNTFVGQAAGNYTLTGAAGIQNTGLGALSLGALTSGANNTCLGFNTGINITSGSGITAVGSSAGQAMVGNNNTTAIGNLALLLTTGGNNTACGAVAGELITSGTDNSLFGLSAGISYTGSESSNICIGNAGVVGESNVMRLGTSGSGAGQVNSTFVAGVSGVTTSNSVMVTMDSTTGKLGTFAIPFSSIVIQQFTASGTFTPTSGMKYCVIELVGGGGGGGGAASTSSTQVAGGAGGAAGGYSRRVVSAATIGASQTVTIGAAGTAGAAGNNAGGTGGTTSVGSLISATGGTGGAGGGANNRTENQGPTGGVGSTGDVNLSGGSGGSAFGLYIVANTVGSVLGGFGGASFFGGGASAPCNEGAQAGSAGAAKGSGGSGGISATGGTTAAGGAGAAGLVIITEYIH